MGCGSKTEEQVICDFPLDLQGKVVADGSVEKHKARFVARGFSQVEGIDYDETFSLVSRYSYIISMLALSAQMGGGVEDPPDGREDNIPSWED